MSSWGTSIIRETANGDVQFGTRAPNGAQITSGKNSKELEDCSKDIQGDFYHCFWAIVMKDGEDLIMMKKTAD